MSNKMWDNSSMQTEIHWDNKSLPGLTDEELYNTNWNKHIQKNKPEHIKKMSEGIKQAHRNGVYANKIKSQQKPVVDPGGKEWESAAAAGSVWFPGIRPEGQGRRVRNLCNANRNGWKWK